MNMEMGVEGKNIAIDMDGDVGIADPGSPVEINFPNLSEYKDMSEVFCKINRPGDCVRFGECGTIISNEADCFSSKIDKENN